MSEDFPRTIAFRNVPMLDISNIGSSQLYRGEYMNDKATSRVRSFTKYLNSLYESVESYIDTTPLHGIKQQIILCHEGAGEYTADKLTLLDENSRRIAEFLPAAALVIGRGGMVYLKGRFSRQTLTYHESYDRLYSYNRTYSPDKANRCCSKSDKKEFRPGWYWHELGSRGLVNSFDEDIFIELMEKVSRYEFE